jgi:type II secretory pathway pseudopilin PulG
MKIFNSRGDTIVEVMIAIIILGAATGGAFAIANRSQQKAQHNHEQYQAQLLANQQAELFRQSYAAYMASGTRAGYATLTNGTFCFTSAATITASCTNGIYTLSIQKVADANAGTASASLTKLNYKVSVTWDGLNGQRRFVELIYGL